MGMASSQARLLSLTARLSDLEYRAQNITNAKLALGRQSDQVSANYIAALDKQVLTVKNPDTNAYMDATAYNLTTYGAISKIDKQRFIKDSSGTVLVSQTVQDKYDKALESAQRSRVQILNGSKVTTLEESLDSALGYHDEKSATTAGKKYDAKQVQYYTNLYSGSEAFMNSYGITSNNENSNTNLTYDAQAVKYYENLYNEMQESGSQVLTDEQSKDPDWLYENLTNGTIFISEYDAQGGANGTGDFVNISWNSGDPSLATDGIDSTALAKAEAEYERATAEIAQKDKRFDMDLKSIDTEHTAIQTEMESVKKVIDKNVERSFKIFDA